MQEPILTEPSHLESVDTQRYQPTQPMVVEEDDDWLHEFALAQMQASTQDCDPANDATNVASGHAQGAAGTAPVLADIAHVNSVQEQKVASETTTAEAKQQVNPGPDSGWTSHARDSGFEI